MRKVLIVEATSSMSAAIESLKEIADVRIIRVDYIGPGITPVVEEDELIREVEDVDAIIVRHAKISRKVFEKAKNLKIIVIQGYVVSIVNLKEATKRGVLVSFMTREYGIDVAEHTLALILAASKKIVEANKYVKRGKYLTRWKPNLLTIKLKNKTLGVLGIGKIGKRVAKIAKAFEMNVIACDPYVAKSEVDTIGVKLVDFQTLLKESDVLTIHAGIKEPFESHPNYHLIGEKQIRSMKRNAFIVNTARGPIIDQKALCKALKEEWIRGAALDVFEKEPPDPTDPIFKLENLVATPHIAGSSDEETLLGLKVVKELIMAFEGKIPENLVNPDVLKYYR